MELSILPFGSRVIWIIFQLCCYTLFSPNTVIAVVALSTVSEHFASWCSSGLLSVLLGACVLYLPQVKEENKKHHPDLVEFSKLPDQEKNLNLQAAQETLRWQSGLWA